MVRSMLCTKIVKIYSIPIPNVKIVENQTIYVHNHGFISHLHRQYFKKNTPPNTIGGVNCGACAR